MLLSNVNIIFRVYQLGNGGSTTASEVVYWKHHQKLDLLQWFRGLHTTKAVPDWLLGMLCGEQRDIDHSPSASDSTGTTNWEKICPNQVNYKPWFI